MGLEDDSSLVRWRNKSPQLVEAVQRLLTDGTVIDVRVRSERSSVHTIGYKATAAQVLLTA